MREGGRPGSVKVLDVKEVNEKSGSRSRVGAVSSLERLVEGLIVGTNELRKERSGSASLDVKMVSGHDRKRETLG